MFIRSTWLKVLFRVISLLLCSLLVLSTFEIGVLKSPILILDLFLSPFMYYSLFFPFRLLGLKSYLDIPTYESTVI